MINLTEKQVDHLIERGYENSHYFSFDTKMVKAPWYKSFLIEDSEYFEGINFRIIINPCTHGEKWTDDVIVGISEEKYLTETEKIRDFICSSNYYNAKEILEELLFLRSIGVM